MPSSALMIRRPPRSTPLYSSAASDVYKRQVVNERRFSARTYRLREVATAFQVGGHLSLIHISEPTRLGMISYAVFCFKHTSTTEIYTSLFVGSVRCV